jgi:hypothetical protein
MTHLGGYSKTDLRPLGKSSICYSKIVLWMI